MTSTRSQISGEAHSELKRQLVLAVGGISMFVVLAGVFYYRGQRDIMRESIWRELDAVATNKALQVGTWRQERMSEALFLMRSPMIARDMASLMDQPASRRAREAVAGWIEPIKGGDRYESILILDRALNVRFSTSPGAPPPELPSSEVIAGMTMESGVVLSDAHLGGSCGLKHLDLLVPVGEPGLPPAAIVLLRIDAANRLFPLVRSWPGAGTTSEVLLARREGRDEVIRLSPLPAGADRLAQVRYRLDEPDLPAAMGARGEWGVHEGVDYRGKPVLTAIRPVGGSAWFVVAKTDTDEAYAPIVRMAWQTGIMVAILLLSVVFCAAYFYWTQRTSLLKRALKAEKERGALSERLALVTRHANDIILLMDGDGRILEANEKALATYGYSIGELRALPPGGLRPPSALQDLEGHLNAVRAVGGAVFQTVHRRKDGSLLDVEASGGTLDIEGRAHLLCIYRDITSRRRSEEQIARQMDELRRWQAVMIDRSDRARRLKREVNELCGRLGEPARYPSHDEAAKEEDFA